MLVKQNTGISRVWVQITSLQTMHQTLFWNFSSTPDEPKLMPPPSPEQKRGLLFSLGLVCFIPLP